MTWRVLDLFCKAGGSGSGLATAWPDADITGIDIEPQPHYPYRFVQADAMTFPLDGYDFYWASPVCKAYSHLTEKKYRGNHPRQIAGIRARLRATGKPYVIENVRGARYDLENPLMLCGSMFGLKVWRHRYFEIWPPLNVLVPPCDHSFVPVLISGSPRRNGNRKEPDTETRRAAMGIPWMSRMELDEAIPPVYAEFIARRIRPAPPQPPRDDGAGTGQQRSQQCGGRSAAQPVAIDPD